ncbi:MAG: YihY/virulence factor BrkB family protein [Conexibacteraceae bacterium]|nr:YihY/virulence factor BrkB family protein [Conexibacteraceae bacterium]
MSALAPVQAVDRYQQEHKPLAVLVATIKKAGDDQISTHATAIAFYAFFSVFPLLLVFLTILGYVLAGDHSLMHSVEDSVLGRFPVIGDTLRHNKLQGSASALIIGIVLSLWSGLSVTSGTQTAFDAVWHTPKREQENFLKAKLRGVVLLAVLGVMFIIASGASGAVSAGVGGLPLFIAGVVISVVLNIGLFLATFRLLGSKDQELRQLVPGAIVAAIVWTILQIVAGAYIGHFKNSNSAYGTFAVVLGLLAWLRLGAQNMVYSAELNSVLAEKKWPRKLMGE